MSEQETQQIKPAAFEELLSLARAGDHEALGTLLDKHRRYLLLIANQDLDANIRGKLGSSDIVQESMLTAHQHFDQFRGMSSPELVAWLRKILVNDIHHARRTFKGTQKRQIDREQQIQQNSTDLPLVDPQFTPGTNAVAVEESELLKSSMAELPEDYREVLESHSWHHQSFDEIGTTMGKSPEAVRKTWTRAVLKLQQIMAKKQFLD